MDSKTSETLLQVISKKIQGQSRSSSQYSSHWKWFLKSKGAHYSIDAMLRMRSPTSSITRGFGIDRRYSPSYDYYIDKPLYREILAIPESDFGEPETLFEGIGGNRHSGIFLRNACFAYEIITQLDRSRDEILTILEIGSGFGMLAYILKHYYYNASLFLVDLPESLSICAWYLENTIHSCSFRYLPVDSDLDSSEITFVNADSFIEGIARYDLVINCDSMSEMTAEVACNYLRIIETDIKTNGMFFLLNREAIDKEAILRPTSYPFSAKWLVKTIQPTYVGFIDDYRHIQICFSWSTRPSPLPSLRNRLLDIAYQYFFNEYLDCFEMFRYIERYNRVIQDMSKKHRYFLQKCFVDNDIEFGAQNWQALYQEDGTNASDASTAKIALIILCDILLESDRISDATLIAQKLAEISESFGEIWAAVRILKRLKYKTHVENLIKYKLDFSNIVPSLSLKAGRLLSNWGYREAAQKAFERVLNMDGKPLEKIEAAMELPMDRPTIEKLYSTFPSYVSCTGYYLTRIATIYMNNGFQDQAYSTLLPILNKQIKAGHYEILLMVDILEKMGHLELVNNLINKSVSLAINDNGFYRKIGLLYEKKQNYNLACEYLKKSLDIDSSWASTHYDLSRIYQKLGQHDLEVKHLTEALTCSYNKEVDYDELYKRLTDLRLC